MPGSVPLRNEVFAANRAVGRISFDVAAAPGGSRRTRVYEAGSLRVRFPNSLSEKTLDAVIVNTAGGMTGGDDFSIEIEVGANARLAVTTASAEKVYRSLGPDTQIGVKLNVAASGVLTWLPQETILFDQVRLRRTIDIDLASDARLLLAEAVVFGRSAMGETILQGSFSDRWRVRVDGALRFAETARLDGEIARHLAHRAVANSGVAIASVMKFPGKENDVAAVRDLQNRFAGNVGISAWNGLTVARLVAPDGATLRRDLTTALSVLCTGPLPRLWVN
jgi:urease accessory protein